MPQMIIVTENGFELVSFKKERLCSIGARAFLAFTGYLTHETLIHCLKNNPNAFQGVVQEMHKSLGEQMFQGKHLKTEKVEVFVSQNLFSSQREHCLYITIREKKYFAVYKRMLLKIIT